MITKVYLLSVPLERDYKHTFYFSSAYDQYAYFNSKVKHTFTDFTYQRKDGVIRIPLDYDIAVKCNYVMYQNTAESSKRYYAFITNYEYKGDDETWITIETDVIQTYLFDYEVKTSFVEREHCSDDTIGLHTYPENLECGEFICKYRDSVTELQDCAIMIGITDTMGLPGSWSPVEGRRYNGIYSGIRYDYYKVSEIEKLNERLKEYSSEGKNDSIKCMFMYPMNLLDIAIDNAGNPFRAVLGSETPKQITKTFTKSFDYSYVPKNNKLYTFPYQYLLVTNNNGGSAIYQFEHFKDSKYRFLIKGCLTPGGSIRLIPENYKGLAKNDEEGFNLGKYPICNWSSDEYTNWLTQNSVNIGMNIASGVGQIIGGIATAVATGGVGIAVGGGMTVGGVSTIANQLAQVHQMSFTSSQSRGNLNCGDVVTADATNTFFFQHMTIKDEYMKVIDEFFDMFGYKCNRVKVPEKNHREHWWYTKTIDVNISGESVPQMDLEKIKNCYNNGITFWKDDIKNYDRTNF